MSTDEVIDYTEEYNGKSSFHDYIAVHGKGRMVLMLSKLEEPVQRWDGKKASYRLEDRSLSQRCEHYRDEAWACVRADDWQFLQRKEIEKCLRGMKKGKTLFDFFID